MLPSYINGKQELESTKEKRVAEWKQSICRETLSYVERFDLFASYTQDIDIVACLDKESQLKARNSSTYGLVNVQSTAKNDREECRQFAKGRCPRGNACPYLHTRGKNVGFKQYGSTNMNKPGVTCKYGTSCRDSTSREIILSRLDPQTERQKSNRQPPLQP
eukprot:TRINITY_DN9322_c0_g1_i1.p1 TRINITY_DN9322_c0_g1~~TRINITY_DN9322_c0_g1_i1.p1  ORF type:complete len:162 (-),score=13.81 TRINITY_DN9322_c0_g1_i1:673-1158(-)